jgi:endoglucanase
MRVWSIGIKLLSRPMFSALVSALLLLATPAGSFVKAADAASMLHAENGAVVGADGSVTLRCVNLSPWLVPEGYLISHSLRALLRSPSEIRAHLIDLVGAEAAHAFWQHWREAFVSAADFTHLSQQGFNCVRLPVDYYSLLGAAPDGQLRLDPEGIEPVDLAVSWAAQSGMVVIIDLHEAPGGQNPISTVSGVPSDDHTARLWAGATAAENQHQTVALWRALAARYASSPAVGGYDLLNEPALPKGLPAHTLATFYSAVIQAIRSVDARHMVIVEGDQYAHDFTGLESLSEGNLLYEFHEYALGNHRWRNPDEAALAPLLQLRELTHRPLWLVEFGEDSAAWQAQVVQLLKAHQIGWAIWPWKRLDLHNGHPVVESIHLPDSWDRLSQYLDGALFQRRPTVAEAQQAMADMLLAVRTQECTEDTALAQVLGGR